MKTKGKLSRFALARRLRCSALQISKGKPILIASTSVSIPTQVVIEEEVAPLAYLELI